MRHLRLTLLLAAALALAGCAAPTQPGHAHADKLHTGDIAPGASATLTYNEAGTFAMHCHPHPSMEHVVRVTGEASTSVHVHILDGASQEEYRFEPASLDIGRGSVVTYHNHGALAHTATQ